MVGKNEEQTLREAVKETSYLELENSKLRERVNGSEGLVENLVTLLRRIIRSNAVVTSAAQFLKENNLDTGDVLRAIRGNGKNDNEDKEPVTQLEKDNNQLKSENSGLRKRIEKLEKCYELLKFGKYQGYLGMVDIHKEVREAIKDYESIKD